MVYYERQRGRVFDNKLEGGRTEMRVDLEIGLSDRDGNAFGEDDPRYQSFLNNLADIAGGLKEVPSLGRYKNRQGKIIVEPSRTITIFLFENEELKLQQIIERVKAFLVETNQESAILVRDAIHSELIEV